MCHTPDRPINEPDDNRWKDCEDCKGSGKVIDWDAFEEETHDVDDDLPKKTCTTCKGDGVVPNEEGGEEW